MTYYHLMDILSCITNQTVHVDVRVGSLLWGVIFGQSGIGCKGWLVSVDDLIVSKQTCMCD